MKKIALILCFCLLLPTFLLVSNAASYGKSTQKLIVTHLKEPFAGLEGTGVIYSKSSDGTIGPFGSFDWWNVVVFEWSSEGQCYVVKSVNAAMNVSKSATVIPENGFVYCCNTGNDYPSLGDNTKPNYTTNAVTDSCNLAASLKVGTKAGLYGADLMNGTIDADTTEWYSDSYESRTFIKLDTAESGSTAFNPELAANVCKLAINAINSSIAEGQAMIITPDKSKVLGSGFDWCRVAIFDWSAKDNAYVLISVDTAENSGRVKNAVIPPNGFALSVNMGNNYPAIGDSSRPNYKNSPTTNTYEKIGQTLIGTKFYLVGIDLANGTFEYEGDINKYYSSEFKSNAYLVSTEFKPENCYEPNIDSLLTTPKFTTTEKVYLNGDVTIAWDAVEGADSYYVHVTDTSATISGKALKSDEITETEFTVSEDWLTDATSAVTVSVYAKSADGAFSPVSYFSYKLCTEKAYNSPFRDLTVVAFGDSITAGGGGWVSSLFSQIGTDVINAGVGGNITAQALQRINKDVCAHNPDIVIINFGMNDQAFSESSNNNLTPIDKYEENYRKIIETIQATGSKVILVAVHDVNPKYHTHSGLNYAGYETLEDGSTRTYVDKYNEVVYKLSQEYNTGFIDINSLAQTDLDNITIAADGIHLSSVGQAKYCEWISNYMYEFIEETVIEEESDVVESGETNEESETSDATKEGDPLWLNILIYAVFIAGISVVGVMFLKVVQKNKK